MLTRTARNLSAFFVKHGVIPAEDRAVYDYCFEILLSTILNLVLVVLIAILSKTLFLTIFYIIGFMLVRSTAGGYHANSHWSCVCILLGTYAIFLFMLKLIPASILGMLSFIFVIWAVLLVIFLSPVEDQNKPLSSEETKRFKRKSRIWIIILALSALSLTIFLPHWRIGFSLSAGMVTVALSLIAGKVKNHILCSRATE